MSDVNDDTVSVILSAIDEKFSAIDKKFEEQSHAIDTKLGAISEEIDHKLAVAIENIGSIIDRKLSPIEDRMGDLSNDMEAVKAAVTDLSNVSRSHDHEISHLKQQVA